MLPYPKPVGPEKKRLLRFKNLRGGVGSVQHQFSLAHLSKAHLSTASNWIGVQTGVHGFDSRTPHKPVVSKTSEADIWLGSYDHLTDVGGQRGR